MADFEEIIAVRTVVEGSGQESYEQGQRDGKKYREGFEAGASQAVGLPGGGSGLPTPQQRLAVNEATAGLVGSSVSNGQASPLSVAEKRAAVQALALAERFGDLDEEERKAIAAVRRNIQAVASEESSILALQRERDRQAKALAAATAKISRQEEIYAQQGTSQGAIRNLAAERQAYTAIASTLSEERRRQLADPNTSTARRIGLELGGSSLLQSERGQLSGSPLGNELRKGFFGTKDPGDQGSFGQSIGQVGRFTALYGGAYALLYQITNGFSAAAAEAINFTNAVSDLNLASGQTSDTNRALADSLGNIAAAAGLAPSQGVSAGAQAIGLYGVAQSPPEVQAKVATASVSVASRIAAVGGTDLQTTQQDLAGLARSLNLSIDRLPGLEDELTYVSRQIGRPVSELLPAVASIGTLGAGAGFSPEELFAAVGQITSTTGQSASGASSSFRQVLSRADDPNFLRKIQEQFGIDTTGKSLRDVFAAFAATQPDSKDLNKFSLLFGRGASQQVAQILGSNFGQIQDLAAGAKGAAGTGVGEDVFKTVTEAFGYQLKELGTQLLNLGKDLASTGILAFLGLLVKGSLEVVKALDQVVQLFNSLPEPLRAVGFGVIELVLASKAISALSPLAGGAAAGLKASLVGGVTRIAGEDAVAAAGGRLAASGGLTSFLTRDIVLRAGAREAGNPIGLLGAAGGLRGAAGGATGAAAALGVGALTRLGNLPLINRLQGLGSIPAGTLGARQAATAGLTAAGAGGIAAGVGVAAVIAVGVIKNLVEISAVKDAIQEGALAIASATNAEQAQAGLEAARGAQKRAQDLTAVGFDLQTLTGGTALNALNATGAVDVQKQADAQVAYAESLQKQFTDAQRAATAATPTAAVTDFTSLDSLNASIETLTVSGYNATERVNAINTAFENLTIAAAGATTAVVGTVQPGAGQLFGVQGGAGANKALQAAIGFADDASVASGNPNFFNFGQDPRYAEAKGALQGVDSTRLQDLVSGTLVAQVAALPKNANGGTDISPEQKKKLEEAALAAAKTILPPNLPDDVRKVLEVGIVSNIDAQINALSQGASGQPSIANLLKVQFDAYGDNARTQGLQKGSNAQGQRAALGGIDRALADAKEAAKALTGDDATVAARQIRNYELERGALLTQIVQAENQEAKLFSEAAASRLKADNAVGRDAIAVKQTAAALKAAKTTGDKDLIAQATIDYNNAKQQQAKDLLDQANSSRLVGIDPRNQQAQLAAQLTNAKATLATLTVGSTEYNQTLTEIAALKDQIRQTAIGVQNARASAGVAGNESAIDQAKVAIANAKRTLAGTLKGTAEYYQALADLRNAQKGLADAQLAYASDLRKLNSDLTDPVAQAKNALADAKAKLAADKKAGAGKDVIAADQVAVQNAQNQAEAAAFNQRLHDAQIADQLGRTSHQAYLTYLQNEHDRLSAITNRTRQQQDELDQVDLAIKAANEQLQGQFNLGDIKVPSPYEVRRYIAETSAAATSGAQAAGYAAAGAAVASGGGTVNNIRIDGADTATVEGILRRILGNSAVSNATTTGRKGT